MLVKGLQVYLADPTEVYPCVWINLLDLLHTKNFIAVIIKFSQLYWAKLN